MMRTFSHERTNHTTNHSHHKPRNPYKATQSRKKKKVAFLIVQYIRSLIYINSTCIGTVKYYLSASVVTPGVWKPRRKARFVFQKLNKQNYSSRIPICFIHTTMGITARANSVSAFSLKALFCFLELLELIVIAAYSCYRGIRHQETPRPFFSHSDNLFVFSKQKIKRESWCIIV